MQGMNEKKTRKPLENKLAPIMNPKPTPPLSGNSKC